MMTNSLDDEDVDIVPEDYYQEVMFDKVSSRTEITCDPVTIWSYDHNITIAFLLGRELRRTCKCNHS